MPLAMAWARWIVRHASTCASAPFVLLGRMPADGGRIEEHLGAEQAVIRAASGYHWSQQISTPIVA
jgi:hypothetical protein